MKKFITPIVFLGLLPISILWLMNGCGDISLSPADSAYYNKSVSNVNFCTTPADTIRSNLKFIFVMDRSGSNQERYLLNSDCTQLLETLPGTDPNGTIRFNALLEFVASFQQDEYIYWSMINFSANANRVQGFTNNNLAFYNFVQNQRNNTAAIDDADTNYLSALDRVDELIQQDIEAAKQAPDIISSNYIVFFVSDGEPIVNCRTQSSESILGKISTIKTKEESEKMYVEGIQFNTAYYTLPPVAPGARDLLNNMSIEGEGDFFEFSNGQNVDFSRFAAPVRVSRFALKEIWVDNPNTVWHNNKLEADTDADGLPDSLERELGSDPERYDSDGNGVGDGVEYRVSGNVRPCQDANCAANNARVFTTCSGLAVTTNPITYPDTDRDYLNDCEERLLGLDRRNPDSNYDYVPDWMAFKNNIALNTTANQLISDLDNDGVIVYHELKKNTPVHYNNDRVPGLIPLQIIGDMVSTNMVNDCHAYSVKNLAVQGPADKVRVFIFENTRSINEKIIYRTVEKHVNPDGSVDIRNEELQ